MTSPQNLLAGLNLSDLASLLQARIGTFPGGALGQAQPATTTAQTQAALLLKAATSASAAAAASAAPSVAARRPAPDPPGSRVAGAATGLSSAVAAAAALNRKRTSSLLHQGDHTAVVAGNAAKKARSGRSWDEMFGALVSYKAKNNNTDVPENYPDDPELGLWVKEQRQRKLVLSTEERYKLDLISFEWDAPTSAATSASATAAPSTSTISASAPSKAAPAPSTVTSASGSPATASRLAAVSTLASFGLQLPSAAAVAAATRTTAPAPARNIFEALAEYKQRIHASPSVRAPTLSLQVPTAQPAQTPTISEAQQHWNKMFLKLQAHKTLHGHCNVLLTNPGDPALGLWVLKQREKYQQGTIPKHHKTLLDALGFESEDLIGAAAAAAVRIRETPPTSASVAKKSEKEDEDTEAKEEADAKERKRVRTFDENFEALLEYKKVHGNVDVPQKYEKDRKLGIWVKNVRQHPQRHSEEQRARLDSIGFKWRKLQLDEQWNDAFKQLLDYKEQYGDCNVPSRWKKCPALARWVHTQRTMYRRNKLLDDRKERLEDAGFVWDCNAMRDDEAFHENYEKLQFFKKTKGHLNIPNKYRRDRPLGRWAAKMRDLYHFDQLDADRKKALTDIGFVWKPPVADGASSATEAASKAAGADSKPAAVKAEPGTAAVKAKPLVPEVSKSSEDATQASGDDESQSEGSENEYV